MFFAVALDAVGKRLGTTRAAYAESEKNEEKGVISLNSLARAADALDCELVYALRPKRRVIYSQIIWEILLEKALHHPWVTGKPEKLKFRALAAIAKYTMIDPKFRKLKGWSKRVSFSD